MSTDELAKLRWLGSQAAAVVPVIIRADRNGAPVRARLALWPENTEPFHRLKVAARSRRRASGAFAFVKSFDASSPVPSIASHETLKCLCDRRDEGRS